MERADVEVDYVETSCNVETGTCPERSRRALARLCGATAPRSNFTPPPNRNLATGYCNQATDTNGSRPLTP
jgi:hypothetical protein